MRILMIDDHTLFREALKLVLERLGDSVVVLEADSVEDGLRLIRHHRDLSLILLDLAMPGMGGQNGLPFILQHAPSVPVIVVSASESRSDVRGSVAAGAAGYIPKTASSQEMLTGVKMVLDGDTYVPPHLLPILEAAADAGGSQGDAAISATEVSLTPRQRQVLALLGSGLSNKVIAHKLGVSEGTVKLHVNAILRALRVNNRTAAVMRAAALGLIQTLAP